MQYDVTSVTDRGLAQLANRLLKPSLFFMACISFLMTGILATVCAGQKDLISDSGKPFYFGVYIYDYRLRELAREKGKKVEQLLDEEMTNISNKGVNAIYLTVSRPEYFNAYEKIAAKHCIKLIPQLEFVYFQEKWSEREMDDKARLAGKFMQQHKDSPQVLAWSVREEIPQKDVFKLARYYSKIRAYAPDAKFNLVHSDIRAARDQPVPYPHIEGTDRYGFWWEFSGGGYLASPSFALNWSRDQFSIFHEEAAKHGADFMAVITQGGLALPAYAQKYGNGPIGSEVSEKERQLYFKIREFAKDGRMGWKRFTTDKGPRYNVWKYYRLPKNCMKALAWSAVMEGARSFFCWAYWPFTKTELGLDFKSSAISGGQDEAYLWTLADRPGKPNPQLDEFAESAREIRQYEKIITSMQKVPDSPVHCIEKDFYNRAFVFPGLTGKVIVLHNANVGTWPANSANFFKDTDPIYIDDDGNLVGYKAFHNEMVVNCNITAQANGTYLFDIVSFKQLPSHNGAYTTSIKPGSGKLLYFGNEEDARKLHDMVIRNTL